MRVGEKGESTDVEVEVGEMMSMSVTVIIVGMHITLYSCGKLGFKISVPRTVTFLEPSIMNISVSGLYVPSKPMLDVAAEQRCLQLFYTSLANRVVANCWRYPMLSVSSAVIQSS